MYIIKEQYQVKCLFMLHKLQFKFIDKCFAVGRSIVDWLRRLSPGSGKPGSGNWGGGNQRPRDDFAQLTFLFDHLSISKTKGEARIRRRVTPNRPSHSPSSLGL